MAIDFEVEPEFQKQVDWVEAFVTEEVEPLDLFIAGGVDESGERLDRAAWTAVRLHMNALQD